MVVSYIPPEGSTDTNCAEVSIVEILPTGDTRSLVAIFLVGAGEQRSMRIARPGNNRLGVAFGCEGEVSVTFTLEEAVPTVSLDRS